MENLMKKLHALRQELTVSIRYNYVATRSDVKSFDECINDFDEILNELELIQYSDLINKDLQHHKDTTIGLYAIDFNPKELIKRFVDSQSDATRLLFEDVEDLVEDWESWIEDENIGKSPFFQIK
jgi:molybdopterin/thiamine biosynthesis adenylyltransferase